jgi:trimeric autotransporter adhesin
MIQVRRIFLGLAVAALPLLAGCSSSTTSTPPPPANSFVYYADGDGSTGLIGSPQLGIVGYPITATSTLLTTLVATAGNGFVFTENEAFQGANLYVVNESTPNTVMVFTPPLTATSNPIAVLTLPAAITAAFGIAFDSAGNMWISDTPNNTITKFTCPCTTTATLVAAVTMVSPANPNGIAFDSSGNLWVALSQGTLSIGEYVLPGGGFVNSTVVTNHLDGLGFADSVAFDHIGNLYAGSDPPGGHKHKPVQSSGVRPAIAEPTGIGFWPIANQVNNGMPTIVNSTGLIAGAFSYQLAFDAAGNLYDADCGVTAELYVYPTATSAWSAALAPVLYSDASITTNDCVSGVAIH